MLKSVFEFRDYRTFLRTALEDRGHGEKSRVAEALKCNIAYVSQVAKGQANFSLEQADAFNTYLGHAEEESDFFLLLVSLERSGTATLKLKFERKIQKVLHDRAFLENRLKGAQTVPDEVQSRYYSTWIYAAIHTLLTIPEFREKQKIADHLHLPLPQVSDALEFLVQSGLARLEHGQYLTGKISIHLKNDSPWASRHLTSWRLQAIHAIDRKEPGHLHYSSVVSMAAEDLPRIRKILVDAIEETRKIVRDSPERGLFCYGLDLFELK